MTVSWDGVKRHQFKIPKEIEDYVFGVDFWD